MPIHEMSHELESLLHKWEKKLIDDGHKEIVFDAISIAICTNLAAFFMNNSEEGKAVDNLNCLFTVIKSIIEQKQK